MVLKHKISNLIMSPRHLPHGHPVRWNALSLSLLLSHIFLFTKFENSLLPVNEF